MCVLVIIVIIIINNNRSQTDGQTTEIQTNRQTDGQIKIDRLREGRADRWICE